VQLTSARELTRRESPGWPLRSNNLSNALFREYERFGGRDTLDEAIEADTEPINRVPDGHPDTPAYLNNYSLKVRRRFSDFGGLNDLNAAIDVASRAADIGCNLVHPDRQIYLNTLGNCLLERYNSCASLHDLDLAIVKFTHAIACSPSHPLVIAVMHNSANAFSKRFGRTGSLKNLNSAIDTRCKLLEKPLLSKSHPERPMYYIGLAQDLSLRATRFGSTKDLERALKSVEEALESIRTSDARIALFLNEKGCLLLQRNSSLNEIDGAIQAFDAAIEAFDRANRTYQKSRQGSPSSPVFQQQSPC
jgi:tetratricopeptide (TPR) repeat protein